MRQNGWKFVEDNFKHIFVNENVNQLIQMSLRLFSEYAGNDMLALPWYRKWLGAE